MIDGGYTEVMEVKDEDEIKIIAYQQKEKVEMELGETFVILEPILYRKQIVNGTNYKVKVHIGDEKFIHLRIHVPPIYASTPIILLELETDKTFFDPLD